MIVASNPRQELSEFYPPPYNFLAPQRRPKIHIQTGTCPYPGCACGRGGRGMRGMGQVTKSGLVSASASVAGTALTTTLMAIAGPLQAIPLWGQIAGAALAITAVVAQFFKGCGSTCILTSNEVNQVEPMLVTNLQQYLALPFSPAIQAEALNNFNQLWQGVLNYCQNSSMGSAGKACISDRQQGSCAYKTSPGGWQQSGSGWSYVYPGKNGSGTACWNWFVGYHDPIANDPRVAQVAATAQTGSNVPGSNAGSGVTSSAPFNFSSLLIPAALAGGVLLFMFGGDL